MDLGTAAAFRAAWAREAFQHQGVVTRRGPNSSPVPLLLTTHQAPGDAVAMTAAIYSLHRAHPNCYQTYVSGTYPEIFEYNPDVTQGALPDNVLPLAMHYPAIHDSNRRGIHFMQAWCEHLEAALGVPVPLLTNRPHLYFDTPDPSLGDYWIVCSGGKRDMTAKEWGTDRYQEVINRCQWSAPVNFIQVGAANHDHPRLSGAVDMVGKTTLRQLFDLVRRARGVLCGVSLLMHVAAALGKPAVVIAGGREPVQWNAYPKQHYLHTVGALPCTSLQGEQGVACWRARTLPLNDGAEFDKWLCERPHASGVPECMTMIASREVAQLVLRYNR